MTPRQARRERREAERKAKKLNLKKARLAETVHYPEPAAAPAGVESSSSPELARQLRATLSALPGLPIRAEATAGRISLKAQAAIAAPDQPVERSKTEPIGFVSQTRPSRADINRANAQHSTGPRTAEGRLASSRNSTKHGLASGQVILPGEDPAALEALLNDLLAEHQPATPTEQLLVKEMAHSYWLTQRAIRLQNECFTADGVNEKQLALFLRYQTTYGRAFYKALNSLLRLKKAAAHAGRGFVSQRPRQPEEFVRQNAPKAPEHHFLRQNADESHRNRGAEAKTQAV